MDPLTGGCLCGAVRVLLVGRAKWMGHCHCTMCRKVHGAAFATFVGLDRDEVQVEDPGGALRRYRSSENVHRSFCSTCGASLLWEDGRHPDTLWVAAGCLDGDPGIRPSAHIFTADAAPWTVFCDGLPKR